jgi:centriolar protein POC1
MSVDFSPLGNLVLSSSKDTSVRMWIPNVYSSHSFFFLKFHRKGNSSRIKGHNGPVRCVRFSKDGKNFVTSSDDKSIKVSHFSIELWLIQLRSGIWNQ